jgi:transposase
MSERTFRRWTRRFEEDGEDGLMDRRLGRRSGRAVPDEEAEEVERLYRERYAGFTAKHFHEHLVQGHGFRWGYTWTKTCLQARGLLAKAPRRGAHRRKRPRRPMAGMMLHQDASRHAWLDGCGPLDLVVTLDDASGEIYSAMLVEEEGTVSSFLGLIETIAKKGLFCSLYTDRGSHYFHTPEAGGKVAKDVLTQVGRALAQLGIDDIAAYSPQARGRSERMFRTLQDRLPKELALAGMRDVEAANRYIREVYLPALERPLRRRAGGQDQRLRARRRGAMARHLVRAGGACRRPRQHRCLERTALADPAPSRPRPLRARQGARAPLSRRRGRRLPWAETLGPLETERRGGSRDPALRGLSRFGGGAPGAVDGGDKAAP